MDMSKVSHHRQVRLTGLSLVLFLSLSFVLAGWPWSPSSQAAGNKAATHSRAHALTTVDVKLGWLSNVEFSSLWVPDHFGWFKQAGIKLVFHPGGTGGISPEDFVSACRGYCFAMSDAVPLAIARSVGNNLKAIWVEDQRTPFGFIACAVTHNSAVDSKCKSRTGRNVTSPRQWKGLRVAYQSGQLYVPEVMLASVGLGIKDVRPVVVGFDTAPLTTGAVDTFDVFINNETIALRLLGVKVNVMPAYKFGMSSFYSDVLEAPDSEINAHPAFVRKFVHLLDRGWKYALTHSNQVADMVVKNYNPKTFGVPTSQHQQELELQEFASELARDQSGTISGRMTLQRWQQIVHILSTYPASLNGKPLITHPVAARSLFTNAFAP
jgi:ABC-type nitrate/sulfonate/bicarbonate transport system substrate-binding protein